MTQVPHDLSEAIAKSNHLQQRLKAHLDQALSHVHDRLHHHQPGLTALKEKASLLIDKLLAIIREKVILHPLIEKCHSIARHGAFTLYKKSLPYLAHLSENAILAAGLGLALGIVFTHWWVTKSCHSYYKNVIKPRTMSGATLSSDQQYGGLESLCMRFDLIVPRITRPNQVLIRVHAASIDLSDIALLSGLARTEKRISQTVSPLVLGRDLSGVVLDVGRHVNHVQVGDSVWSAQALAANGTLCEFVVVNADTVRLKPAHLGHDGAATLPFSSLKVWDALVHQGKIKPKLGLRSKHVLIVDAVSPTGCIAIQVVKAWGGRVTACVNHNVTPLAKHLGADRVISLPHDPDKAQERCLEAFAVEEKPFDICLLTLEDSSLSESFCLEFSKQVVKSSSEFRLASDAYGFFRRRLLSFWRSIWTSKLHHLDVRPLDHFSELVEAGKLQPVLDSAYAYEQAEEAFQATATTTTVGKTIITFGLRGHRDIVKLQNV